MESKHQKITEEFLEEYKENERVIGFLVFGSVAVNKERVDSDVNIAIVFDACEWELFKKERYGIPINLEFIDKKNMSMILDDYPYLANFKGVSILLDKEGFVKRSVNRLKKYHEENPEVKRFWDEQHNNMKETKAKGGKVRNFIDVCDEAEIRFSDHHSIKRKILTAEFFHKHMRR